jgi:hypothetical protein
VRVRLFRGTRLLVDVGGPYVLAPVAAVLRDAGERPIGRVVLAVQDDMGYMLLAHRFTGAEVVMRVGSHQVMGTLRPGPRRIPDAGPVTYRGTRYEAVSFKATAFPTGSLRISLLVRPGARAR